MIDTRSLLCDRSETNMTLSVTPVEKTLEHTVIENNRTGASFICSFYLIPGLVLIAIYKQTVLQQTSKIDKIKPAKVTRSKVKNGLFLSNYLNLLIILWHF